MNIRSVKRNKLDTLFDCGHYRTFTSRPSIGDFLYCTSCNSGATVVAWDQEQEYAPATNQRKAG